MGPSNNNKKAAKSLRPQNVTSPFGSISTSGHQTTYQPTYQPGQQAILADAPQQESQLVANDIPTATKQYENQNANYLGNVNSLTAGNMVNPQVYKATYGLESQPLLTQYHNDQNALEGKLAAENLSGGSYDAYAHNLQNQTLGQNLNTAANNAVLSGLQGTGDYLGWQQNGVNSAAAQLSNLNNTATNDQNLSSGLQSQLLQPFQDYSGYQSALNPLTETKANLVAGEQTPFQQYVQPFIQPAVGLGASAIQSQIGGNTPAGLGGAAGGAFGGAAASGLGGAGEAGAGLFAGGLSAEDLAAAAALA